MWLQEHIVEETSGRLLVSDPSRQFRFELNGQAPVQGIGEVGQRDFYFRARHEEWSCEVSDTAGQLPSDGRAQDDAFIRQGQYANASYMSFRDALQIIDRCMTEYFARESV